MHCKVIEGRSRKEVEKILIQWDIYITGFKNSGMFWIDVFFIKASITNALPLSLAFILFRTRDNVLYLLFTGKPGTAIIDHVWVVLLGGY